MNKPSRSLGEVVQTTVAFSWRTKKWGAACRDCRWLGPERETHKQARDDQIEHLRTEHE